MRQQCIHVIRINQLGLIYKLYARISQRVITTCTHLTLVIIVACSVGQSVAKRVCVNVAHGDIGMKVLLV